MEFWKACMTTMFRNLMQDGKKFHYLCPSWLVRYSWPNSAKKLTSNILLQEGSSTRFDQMETTDGEQLLFWAENTRFLDLFRKPKLWQLFPKAQSLDQVWKFILWKFVTDMEQKLRFHQSQIQWTHLTLSYPTIWPSTVSSLVHVEFPYICTVGQQRQQISELQVDKFPNLQSFLVWKIRFKNQVTTCPDFPSEAVSRIKEVEMVVHWKNWSPRAQFLERFFQISRCWTRRLLLLWTRSSRILTSRRSQSPGTECPEGGPVSTRKKDRFHDLRKLSSDWRSWPSIRLCWFFLSPFMTTMIRNSKQDGMKFYYLCQRFTQMISWKVCANWEYVSPRNLKLYWNCTTWKFIRRYRSPIIRSWRRWWREAWIRNSDCQILTPEVRENWIRSSGQESQRITWHWKRKGICHRWKEKVQCSKGDRCSFRHESNDRALNPTPRAAPPSEPPTPRGRSAPRKRKVKGKSQTGIIQSTAVQTLFERYLHEITLWVLASSWMSIL